jgi:hypothetical protein
MDTKGHEKFKGKFALSKNLAGRKFQTMKSDMQQHKNG